MSRVKKLSSRASGVWFIVALAALASAGCATHQPRTREVPALPKTRPGQPLGTQAGAAAPARAAQHAAKMVGRPYRYGGASPASGFDCSGLIQFSFRQAGVVLPRTTRDIRRAAVLVSNPRAGDLLFFDQEGKKNSHAGIYLGNGKFVHAPSSGKRVRIDRLDADYWRRHLSEVRRVKI